MHDGRKTLLLLANSFSLESASGSEMLGLQYDPGLCEFWKHSASADLFKDVQYGQWGLHILSPSGAREKTEEWLRIRPTEFRNTDVVIGAFYGDGELLVMDTDKCGTGGCVMIIAMEIDSRKYWPTVAQSFVQFLSNFVEAQGSKYWERMSRPN